MDFIGIAIICKYLILTLCLHKWWLATKMVKWRTRKEKLGGSSAVALPGFRAKHLVFNPQVGTNDNGSKYF